MLSIRRQLIRTQTFSWIITAVLGALVLIGIVRQANFATQILEREERLLALERISGGVFSLSNTLRNHAVTGSVNDLEAFHNQQTALETRLGSLKLEATDRVTRKMQTWVREYAGPVIEARSLSQAKALRVL